VRVKSLNLSWFFRKKKLNFSWFFERKKTDLSLSEQYCTVEHGSTVTASCLRRKAASPKPAISF
jgi:hypothetical protein